MCVAISLFTVSFCPLQFSHTNIFPRFPGLHWDFFTPQIIQHTFQIFSFKTIISKLQMTFLEHFSTQV